MLTLVETLQPVYEQQPRHVNARLAWLRLRVSYLNQAGRTDEALRLQKQLAADYPRDYSAQQQYAQALAGGGDYPSAFAWLTRVLVKESKWLDYEEERLRNTYAELLEQQGRFTDLVAYLAAWVEQNPAGTAAYQQYLSALIKTDQIEKADALALRWLKDAQVPDKLSPPADARLEAAIYLMRGNIYRLYTNHVEERWLSPLAQAALYFARHEAHASSADLILSNDQFARTEEARALRKALAKILPDEAGKLPAEQVLRFVGW